MIEEELAAVKFANLCANPSALGRCTGRIYGISFLESNLASLRSRRILHNEGGMFATSWELHRSERKYYMLLAPQDFGSREVKML
jgi:hypothetical protein